MKKVVFEDEEEFDTVILLDACRWDYYVKFRESPPGWVLGNTTGESIPEMFPGYYVNTVFVSGNPLINSKKTLTQFFNRDYRAKDHFIKIDDVWLWGWEKIAGKGFDGEEVVVETTAPWNIVEATEKWQRKGYKTVIHFMQPHGPFIGKYKSKVGEHINMRSQVIEDGRKDHGYWMNDISKLRTAYYYNLKEVLKWALSCVNGKTIITADHGEGLGVELDALNLLTGQYERKTFEGHPATKFVGEVEELRKVPYEVIS